MPAAMTPGPVAEPAGVDGGAPTRPPVWFVASTGALAAVLLTLAVAETSLAAHYLIDAGEFREAAMPVWTLLALAWSVSDGVSETRDACGALLTGMGFERPHGVALRLADCRRWIGRLVELIGLPDPRTQEPHGVFEDAGPSVCHRWTARTR